MHCSVPVEKLQVCWLRRTVGWTEARQSLTTVPWSRRLVLSASLQVRPPFTWHCSRVFQPSMYNIAITSKLQCINITRMWDVRFAEMCLRLTEFCWTLITRSSPLTCKTWLSKYQLEAQSTRTVPRHDDHAGHCWKYIKLSSTLHRIKTFTYNDGCIV